MRTKQATLVLLITVALVLSIGCTAADEMTTTPTGPGSGSPIADVNPPAHDETLGGGSGAAGLR